MGEKTNNYLVTEPVGKIMAKYAIPCIISLLVAALYNIVDQLFIANAAYLGSYGNAANTVVYPLTIVPLSLAMLCGDGCCAFVSISLGAGKKDDAHRSVGNAIVLCVIMSVIVTAVYLIFQNPILTMFGGRANEQTFAYAKEYFYWITAGVPFYMFGQAMNPIIRSDGNPNFAMASTLTGCFMNVILDPIFIYIFKWGMMGAALATILGQIATAFMALWYLFHMKSVKISRKSFGLFPRLMKRFLPLGMTSFLSQISLVVSMAAVNSMCTKYGALDPIFGIEEYTQIPLAVLGIVMKFYQIVISIAIGLSAGSIPVIGYNVGAGRKDRTRALLTRLLLIEAAVGFVATLIVEFFPAQIIALFGAANESVYYTEFAVKTFRTYLCTMTLSTVNKCTFITLQSLDKALPSTILSLLREIVFGAGFAVLLPVFFGLDGLLYSFPLADIITFLIAIVIIRQTYRDLSDNNKARPVTQGSI